MVAYRLDYSAGKLSGETIKRAGYVGTIRYIDSPINLRAKHTNRAEYQDHIANGLSVDLVMQATTTDADGGHARGVTYAHRALAGAEAVGHQGVIFFVNDRTTLPNPQLWVDYLHGAASVLGWGRVGAYGFFNAIDVAKNKTPCKYFWQAGRRSDARSFINFWQDNNFQPTVGGILCDRNLIINDISQEDDMAGEIADKLARYMFEQMENISKLDPPHRFRNKHPGDMLLDATGYALDAAILIESLASDPNLIKGAIKEAVHEYLAANPLTVAVDYTAIAKAVNDDAARRGID